MSFGRLERRAGAQPMSDINMTPLIDVMLVLLVIFIIAAPLMASSLKLDLPKAVGGSAPEGAQILQLAIDSEGRWYAGDEAVSGEQLTQRAQAAAARDKRTEVHLRADARVPYGRVAEMIGRLQEAGLSRIGFVTQAGATPAAAAPPETAQPQK